MKSTALSSSCALVVLLLHGLFNVVAAYKPLSEGFLRNITSGGADFDPNHGRLLSPILTPRVPGTAGHAAVQRHFIDFFDTQLPKWTMEWYNSTARTQRGNEVPIANLLFKREPPWTKHGQANWLTLAAHYDSKSLPKGFVGATDSAVPCALLMHVARSIDQYVTQMHVEMAELGEGGTVEMDMGVQILFLDGKESLDANEPAFYGSRALSETWEMTINPAGSKYPNALSQVSLFVLLDALGAANPAIPSYFLLTHWAYKKMASLEARLRGYKLLETTPRSPFLLETKGPITETTDDYVPFMNRGTPFLQLLPSPLPNTRHTMDDNGAHLDLPTVKDWAKIVTGFALEWLDMMEVWPE
ncbi:peptide hydrolase-5 [Coleophoma crateriformis]|uniref:Peptide hydrolase n=1 Tax=Coleophoma crateriformis TaxID=565419 RepID=A0A3D8R7I7_9HELO|nr:peptide hydrolase-5 [Coleophoma crateriformis]